MKYIVVTSILALSLMLTVKAGAQAQPAAIAPQVQPTPPAQLPAPQVQPAPVALQAQPQTQALQTLGALPAVATTHTVPDEKSPMTALTGTLIGTGLGIGMLTTGLVRNQGVLSTMGLITLTVGPSFGYFYTGETGRAAAHIGVRAGAIGVMYTGLVLAVFDSLGCALGAQGPCDLSTTTRTFLLGGALIGASSIAYSIYDAPRSAKRYNARHRRLMLVPMPMTGPDSTSGLGLQFGGSF